MTKITVEIIADGHQHDGLDLGRLGAGHELGRRVLARSIIVLRNIEPAQTRWEQNGGQMACRKRFASSGPNFLAQRRIVSQETTMPRSSSISSTNRSLNVKRTYSHTVRVMISGGKRWRLSLTDLAIMPRHHQNRFQVEFI